MFEDSSSDEEAPKTLPTEEEKPTKPKGGLFDDSSDEDEGDAVFDDKGAVVGSSAPPPTEAKEEAKEASSIEKTQEATVLEATRPKEGTSLHMTKLPNVVGIQSKAFDEIDYDEKEEEEQYKGYVHNMIRWRYKKDDSGELLRNENSELMRESNTKLVKWSDGSYTLHIGKEAFDIQTVDSSTSNGFQGLNGYVYLSQKATFGKDSQNGGTVLECIGPVSSKLVAKPSSLQSEAHKSLTVAVRQRTVKRAKIAQYMTEEDPEKLKQERIKYNADADKIKQRKRSTYQRGGRRPGMNKRYLEAASDEDDEGYDTVNLRALKKGRGGSSSHQYDMDEMDDYGDESDDDYQNESSFSKHKNRKRLRASNDDDDDDDDDEEMVFDDDDDDDEVVNLHKTKKSVAVLDDDE